MKQYPDYYSILQLSPEATSKDIKIAFRNLARKYHPDLNRDDTEATIKFQQVSQAYEVLADEKKRSDYDLERSSQSENQTQPIYNRRAQKLYDQGLKKAQHKQYQRAVKKYSKAINIEPNFVDAYLKRCEMYYMLGNHQKILDDCVQIIKINPSIIEAFYYRGIAYYGLGYVQKAIDSYSEVILQKPHSAQAYYGRGIAYQNLKKTLAAIEDFQTAARLFLVQKDRKSYLMVQENLSQISNLSIANDKLNNWVGGGFKALKNSLKTGKIPLLNLIKRNKSLATDKN